MRCDNNINIVYRNRRIMGLDAEYNGVKLYIRDSWQLQPWPLDKLGKSYGCEVAKGKLPYQFITEKTLNYVGIIPPTDGFFNSDVYSIKLNSIEYIKKDLFILFDVMNKFTMSLENDYGVGIKTSYSLSGIAYKIWRTYFYNKAYAIANLDKNTNMNLRSGLFGGVVTIFKTHVKSNTDTIIKYYDVNSLYPYSMLNDFPVGMPTHIILNNDTNDISKYYGMLKVQVTVSDDIQWPFLMYNDKGLIQPVGTWIGWFTSIELDYAQSKGLAKIDKIFEVYHFESRYPVFKSYVETFYKKKTEATDSINRHINKLLLNSLYGRIGMRQETDKFAIVKHSEWNVFVNKYKVTNILTQSEEGVYCLFDPTPLNVIKTFEDHNNDSSTIDFNEIEDPKISNEIVKMGSELEPNTCNVIVASFITGYSRIYMDKNIRLIRAKGSEVIYSDTDSIVCNTKLPKELVSNTEIGLFKDEYPNNIIDSITVVAPKAYELKLDNGQSIIKYKGVHVNSMTSDDMKLMLKGGIVTITNDRFKQEEFKSVSIKNISINVKRSYTKFNVEYGVEGEFTTIKPWKVSS